MNAPTVMRMVELPFPMGLQVVHPLLVRESMLQAQFEKLARQVVNLTIEETLEQQQNSTAM